MRRLAQVWSNDDGQDLIEYALLAAFVSVAAIAAVTGLGSAVLRLWTSVAAQLANATG
jgi:Flp pilus assembly pilin Flp